MLLGGGILWKQSGNTLESHNSGNKTGFEKVINMNMKNAKSCLALERIRKSAKNIWFGQDEPI